MNRKSLYQVIKERDGLICDLCGISLEEEWLQYKKWATASSLSLATGTKMKRPNIKRTKINIDLDHKIPKSLAKPPLGRRSASLFDSIDNLHLTHRTCNTKKGATIFAPDANFVTHS